MQHHHFMFVCFFMSFVSVHHCYSIFIRLAECQNRCWHSLHCRFLSPWGYGGSHNLEDSDVEALEDNNTGGRDLLHIRHVPKASRSNLADILSGTREGSGHLLPFWETGVCGSSALDLSRCFLSEVPDTEPGNYQQIHLHFHAQQEINVTVALPPPNHRNGYRNCHTPTHSLVSSPSGLLLFLPRES